MDGSAARAAAAALALAGSGGASGAPAGDAAQVVAAERAFGQAFVTGDAAALGRLLDRTFLGVSPSGATYDAADLAAGLRSDPPLVADAVDPLSVRIQGSVAVVQAVERQTGPAPELRPQRRVFTDTWIRRPQGWRLIAAEDLDPGPATPAAFGPDEAAIRAARRANNAAIRARDLAGTSGLYAEDAAFVFSDGSTAAGRAALERRFAGDYQDPGFIAYVRTPSRVSVSEAGARASEVGVWTALKTDAAGPTRYGGDYLAHWTRTPAGWRVRGEIYVKLYCGGPRCQP